MSREIKFRAWAKGRMWKSYSVDDHGTFCVDADFGDEVECSDYIAIQMQYTGLKDANGVEVFEGDIVDHVGQARKVEYLVSQGGWALRAFPRRRVYRLVSHTPVTVIGNIHQSPELLK